MLEKRVFTTAEAAAYLGIAPQTLRLSRSKSAAAAGVKVRGIPFLKIGGRVHYERDDLDAWLLKQRRGEGSTFSKFPQRSRDGVVFIPRELAQKMEGRACEAGIFLKIVFEADSDGRLDMPWSELKRLVGVKPHEVLESLAWLVAEGWLETFTDNGKIVSVVVANHRRYLG